VLHATIFLFLRLPTLPISPLFPYTTLFRAYRGCSSEPHERRAQARRGARTPHLPLIVRVPSASVTSYCGSGSSSGPDSTSPLVAEKFEEWQGQMMASSVTVLTWQPW